MANVAAFFINSPFAHVLVKYLIKTAHIRRQLMKLKLLQLTGTVKHQMSVDV